MEIIRFGDSTSFTSITDYLLKSGHVVRNTTFRFLWSEIISNTVDLRYSYNQGVTWTDVVLNTPNHNGEEFGQGYYDWSVPSDLVLGDIWLGVFDHDYQVGVLYYTTVTSEIKYIGSTWRLTWSEFVANTLRIEYQINGQGDWVLITDSAPNHNGPEQGSGFYDWSIDAIECDYLVVRITDVVNNKEVLSPAVTIQESSSQTALVIINQPKSYNGNINEIVTFSIIAKGEGNITYQWYKNNHIIPGETSDILSLVLTIDEDGSRIFCRVRDDNGYIDSNVVTVSIIPKDAYVTESIIIYPPLKKTSISTMFVREVNKMMLQKINSKRHKNIKIF